MDKNDKLWVLFNQYYEPFGIIIDSGAFEVQYGKVILNFTKGILQAITKEEGMYRREKDS